MSDLSLPHDDLSPSETTQNDRLLNRQLEESVSKHFYETCDGVTQGLLLKCEWSVVINADALTLVIACPDMMTNWRVLNNLVQVGNALGQFIQTAKIRISPPVGTGIPLEIRVNEISVHRDLF